MSGLAGRTWTGSRDGASWTAVMCEYSPDQYALDVTWEWDDAGRIVTTVQSVLLDDYEEAFRAAAALDDGDDMTGWEDGNGHGVDPLSAADADSMYAVMTAPWSFEYGLMVCVQVPEGWEAFEALDGYDRRNGTGFAELFMETLPEGRHRTSIYRPEHTLLLSDTPEEALAKETAIRRFLAAQRLLEREEGGRPTAVVGTGRITSTGNSLIIKVTKECGVLGLDRGDPVEYTIRRI